MWVLQAGCGIDSPLCRIKGPEFKCFGKSDGMTLDTGGYTLLPDVKEVSGWEDRVALPTGKKEEFQKPTRSKL